MTSVFAFVAGWPDRLQTPGQTCVDKTQLPRLAASVLLDMSETQRSAPVEDLCANRGPRFSKATAMEKNIHTRRPLVTHCETAENDTTLEREARACARELLGWEIDGCKDTQMRYRLSHCRGREDIRGLPSKEIGKPFKNFPNLSSQANNADEEVWLTSRGGGEVVDVIFGEMKASFASRNTQSWLHILFLVQ